MSTPFVLQYPAALDDAKSLGVAKNDAGGFLAATIAADATSFSLTLLSDANEFGESGALTIDDEIIYFGSRSGVTFSDLLRGQEGTTAASHAAGAVVENNITAAYHAVVSAAIQAIEAKVGYTDSNPASGTFFKGTGSGASAWSALSSSDLATALGTQTANTVYAGPTSGGAASPSFRTLVSADIPSHTQGWGTITSTPTTLSGYGITDAYPLSGNPSGFLTANQSITLSGDASGSGATSIAVTLATVNASPGTYTNATITVDAKGRVTAASSGTGGAVTANATVGAVPYLSATDTYADSPISRINSTTIQVAAINGGAAANDDLTLQGTSHATRTTSYVILQPNGGNVGIGTTTPGARLEVYDSATPCEFRVNIAANTNFGRFAFYEGATLAGSLQYIGTNYSTASRRGNFEISPGTGGKIVFSTTTNTVQFSTGPFGVAVDQSITPGRKFRVGQASDAFNGIELVANSTTWTIDHFGNAGSPTNYLRFSTPAGNFFSMTNTGELGVGIVAPSARLHVLLTNTTTNAINTLAIFGHDLSSGTAAAGMGGEIRGQIHSTTTASQNAMTLDWAWVVATHASRTARSTWGAFDSSARREAVRVEATGSAAAIGFLGAAAIARPASYTVTGTATRTFPTDPSGSYTGIDNAQAGSVYAQFTDLDTLRGAVSSLLGVVRQLVADLGSTSGFGLLAHS